jgi:hypothetical protein
MTGTGTGIPFWPLVKLFPVAAEAVYMDGATSEPIPFYKRNCPF